MPTYTTDDSVKPKSVLKQMKNTSIPESPASNFQEEIK
jgi:hypothetical protein